MKVFPRRSSTYIVWNSTCHHAYCFTQREWRCKHIAQRKEWHKPVSRRKACAKGGITNRCWHSRGRHSVIHTLCTLGYIRVQRPGRRSRFSYDNKYIFTLFSTLIIFSLFLLTQTNNRRFWRETMMTRMDSSTGGGTLESVQQSDLAEFQISHEQRVTTYWTRILSINY